MSATLIAVVIALILGHTAAPLTQLRRFGWFTGWLKWLREHVHGRWITHPAAIFVSLGLPLALAGGVQHGISDWFFGLPGFVFALAMLFYCWGPRDLDIDVEAALDAQDSDTRNHALRAIAGEGTALPTDAPAAVTAIFRAAQQRWFGVLFWFLLLGAFGALLYRLAQQGTQAAAREHLPSEQSGAFAHLTAILQWPVAQLMTLALALAGNFDAVFGAWRDWHNARRNREFDFDPGFLDAAAQASVKREHSQRQAERTDTDEITEEVADIGYPPHIEPPIDAAPMPPDAAPEPFDHAALAEAMGLVWRVLIVWLAALAVFVLAGYA